MAWWMAVIEGAKAATNMAAAYREAQVAQKTLRFNARVAERDAEQQALFLERDAMLADLARSREAAALAFDLDTFDRATDLALGATRAAIGETGTEFSGSNRN